MVMVLVPAAKETGVKETLKTKDNSNGKRNRFILITCGNLFSVIPYIQNNCYHTGFLKAILFIKESELQIAFSCKNGYG
jgi:hypothetical protein